LKFERRNLNLGVLIGTLFVATNTFAIEFVQTEEFITHDDEVLREEIWISAQTAVISGEAQDDLFATGVLLDLGGLFQGDVWGAGEQVVASGTFEDHARLAGQRVHVSGDLAGSLVVLGNTIEIDPLAVVDQNVICLAGNVISEGKISGDVLIMARSVTLRGVVEGDVSIVAQDIVVMPGTRIDGNLSYTASKELVLSPSISLGGKLIRRFKPAPQVVNPNLVSHLLFGLAAWVTGLAFIGLFPRCANGSFIALRDSLGLCILIGFASLCMLPILALLLSLTVIGFPLSLLVISFYLSMLYLSKIVVALWIGSAILRRRDWKKSSVAGCLVIGLFVIYSLTSFTVASILIHILIAIFGLGALLSALFKRTKTLQPIQPKGDT